MPLCPTCRWRVQDDTLSPSPPPPTPPSPLLSKSDNPEDAHSYQFVLQPKYVPADCPHMQTAAVNPHDDTLSHCRGRQTERAAITLARPLAWSLSFKQVGRGHGRGKKKFGGRFLVWIRGTKPKSWSSNCLSFTPCRSAKTTALTPFRMFLVPEPQAELKFSEPHAQQFPRRAKFQPCTIF